ncbi:MAG TPA: type II toxin-antitoxin system PemK/MazF family toxin [Tepidisphaeraceae bacterium]|nr:type II toxin-antitoxin system PemK/MazF family toxin [Tepidisphaeraceae bacterium]
MVIERFGVYLAALDPGVGAEMRKTRPCLVISPQEMHRTVRTVIIAPLTSTQKGFPFRVDCAFQGHKGEVALDQMRALDRSRFGRHLGQIDSATAAQVILTLKNMFA